MLSSKEAIDIISKTTPKAQIEAVHIKHCIGRVIAKHIKAQRDQPPFDRVTMDGVAINSTSSTNIFPIEGIQAAGSPRMSLISKNACIEVMTGAPLPSGCDCVVPYEKVELSIDKKMATLNTTDIQKMKNIHPKGSDYIEKDILLEPGTMITSPIMAIISSQGLEYIDVYLRPKIAIISTGSELVVPGQKILDHQIFMSNTFAIEAELRLLGIQDIRPIHLIDNIETTKQKLAMELSHNDVIIITGGVSKGKYDYIPEALESLGVKKHFHKVKQKPGKPMWYGTYKNKQVFALPGNPVSSLVCLRRYVTPSLQTNNKVHLEPVYATLTKDIEFKAPLTLFKPVKVSTTDSAILEATPINTNSSGDFNSLGQTSGFVELPENRSIFKKGEVFQFFNWQI